MPRAWAMALSSLLYMGFISAQNTDIKPCCFMFFFFFFLFCPEGIRQIVLTPVIQGGGPQTHQSQWRGLRIQREFTQLCVVQWFAWPRVPSVPCYPHEAGKESKLCAARWGCPKGRCSCLCQVLGSHSGKNTLRKQFCNIRRLSLGVSHKEKENFITQKKSNELVHLS